MEDNETKAKYEKLVEFLNEGGFILEGASGRMTDDESKAKRKADKEAKFREVYGRRLYPKIPKPITSNRIVFNRPPLVSCEAPEVPKE